MDYDYQTLANFLRVAKRFEFSRRRENLSWGHHEAVAFIEEDAEQDKWLDRATAKHWSVADLRRELRAAKFLAAQQNALAAVRIVPSTGQSLGDAFPASF